MTLQKVKRKYKERFVLLQPMLRDAETKKPLTFRVLKACWQIGEAEEACRFYCETKDFPGVFILPCFEGEVDLPSEHVARMFRILNGSKED